MTAWNADDGSDLDFQIAQNGSIALFRDPDIVARALTWFADRGYATRSIDAATWANAADMHADLADELDFPSYYGRNLDALADVFTDIGEGEYGWEGSESGLVIAIDHFDRFWRHDERVAQALLDVFSRASRYALLFGNRLFFLLRSDDGSFAPVLAPAGSVQWNPEEWPDAKRRGT